MLEPATAASAAPFAIHTDKAPDVISWLPECAAERLRQLRQHVQDLHAVIPDFADRKAAADAKVDAEKRLKRLTDHASGGGYGLSDSDPQVLAARDQVAKLGDEARRLEALYQSRSQAWTAASAVPHACEGWLREGRPHGTVLVDHEHEVPKLAKGEAGILDQIENGRRRIRELQADLHRLRSAPLPSSYRRAKARAEIEALAQRGAPSASRLVENDRDIEWPTEQIRVAVHNAGAAAVGFAEVPDTIALFAWLHREALIKRVCALVDEEADDAVALSHSEREKAEAVVLGVLLETERVEAALVWKALSDRLPAEHRGDASPLAILGIKLVAAPAIAGGTSPGQSFELAWAR